MSRLVFQSTKTYTHAQGLSCCFRQWRATHSHCSRLHGYAIQVKMVFEALELDERNWVVDFGGLKEVKQFLTDNFDHKTLVARDDPQLSMFRELEIANVIDLNIVPNVGCEAFAEMIYAFVNDEIIPRYSERVLLRSVEVREHESNSALIVLQDD